MTNFATILATLTLEDIKNLEAEIKVRKADLKASQKVNKVSEQAQKVDNVNAMIRNGELKVGMEIVVLYGAKNLEVKGVIAGVLNEEKKTITVESDAFDSKEGGVVRRYIEKYRFVKVA